MKTVKESFGILPDGREVNRYTLINDHGMSVSVLNYGGIISHLKFPSASKEETDVVLGYDSLEEYLDNRPYLGCVVGRYANRIADGRFTIDGKEYILAKNNGPNHLHGGPEGFHKKLWTAALTKTEDELRLSLACESAHLEEGYPGNLWVEVQYSLNNQNELGINYRVKTDQPTVVNLTNHSYFNLSGMKEKAGEHLLRLDCSFYTPVDADNIPTGEILSVNNTPFDFHELRRIDAFQNVMPKGYDHNFVIPRSNSTKPVWFAKAVSGITGICMEAASNQPGVQLYTAWFLNDPRGKAGHNYQAGDGFCLETQHFPDSPNQSHFPSALLLPENEYNYTTVYRFSLIR